VHEAAVPKPPIGDQTRDKPQDKTTRRE
jgi:hypothetical protein